LSNQNRRKAVWINVALIAVGIGVALTLVIGFFALFPQYRPGYVTFTVRMGDIFFNHPEWVVKPEEPDAVLSIHALRWDADGFRLPARQAASYPILALGDSFTEAANAPRPWPDVVAAALDIPVRNLGFRGYGPVEETEVLRRYGTGADVDTVVIGFFEGNDLANVVSAQDQPFRLPSEVEPFRIIPTDFETITVRDPRYPMTVMLNGEPHPIAFFEWYVWNLNTEIADVQRSQNMALLRAEWDEMRALAPETCLVLAYLPSKPHIYLPYLTPESQAKLLEQTNENRAPAGEPLRTIPMPGTPFDAITPRLGHLRDAVREAALEAGLAFFDTTPILEQAAARGEMVYYVYDTHLNQRGHDLVGAAIAEYLRSDPCAEGNS
jgi:hypothetical protein